MSSELPSGSHQSPARRPLSRERVLAVALDLVDRGGLDTLTMRRLAAELGVEPMAIYRHAQNKDDLLAGIVETVMASVRVDSASTDWRSELHGMAERFRGVVVAHPHVLPLVATRPLTTPLARRPKAMLRQAENVLDLLCRAGFDDIAALACYRAFVGYLLGHLLVELRETVDNPDECEPILRLGLHRLALAEFPRLRALAPRLDDYDGSGDLHQGLDALFDAHERARSSRRNDPPA